jgi:hypothetical protein
VAEGAAGFGSAVGALASAVDIPFLDIKLAGPETPL